MPLTRRAGHNAAPHAGRAIFTRRHHAAAITGGAGDLALAAALRAILAALASLAADNFEKTPNTQIFNQTGQPAISLPLHMSPDGLPIGVQLSAQYGDEATLLRLAAQLEQAAPWIDRKPPVSI